MVNILYPELNKSSRHVSNYFDNVPASTSAVLGEEFPAYLILALKSYQH